MSVDRALLDTNILIDIQLVATMLGNGITRIYTFNRNDFAPFAELEVLAPSVDAPPATPGTSPASNQT